MHYLWFYTDVCNIFTKFFPKHSVSGARESLFRAQLPQLHSIPICTIKVNNHFFSNFGWQRKKKLPSNVISLCSSILHWRNNDRRKKKRTLTLFWCGKQQKKKKEISRLDIIASGNVMYVRAHCMHAIKTAREKKNNRTLVSRRSLCNLIGCVQ